MHMVHLQERRNNYRVGKIICLGRNYAEHIKELGNQEPEEPVIFLKPASSIIRNGEKVVIPPYAQECHHEVELALLIGSYGKNISVEKALDHVAGYGVALDMTLRDVQSRLKAKGLPWEIAKAFDTSCPVSDFIPRSKIEDPQSLAIRLLVNDQLRQEGNTAQMIHRIPDIIAHISRIFTLEEGDIILTGTPSGVGPVSSGDRMKAEIDTIGSLEVSIQ